MGFGDAFADALNEQFGLAENTPSSLDNMFGGIYTPFANLGDFRSKIDTTAQRQYIEDGIIRNVRPRASEAILQEPDLTVIIKKRIFSSLIENYRTDLMCYEDKLFLRATKKLFYNKCRVIAAYERATKIERIMSQSSGIINDFAIPIIGDAVDALNALPTSNLLIDPKTQAILQTVRKVKAFSDPSFVTTWVKDPGLPYATDTGEGTGVFELTLVQNMSCTTSTKFGEGRASLTVEDPYKMMIITNEEIDEAISEAANFFGQNNFFRLTQHQLKQSIDDMKQRLNYVRQYRGASPIRFYINEETKLYKKVRAVIDEEGREIQFNFDAGLFGSNLFSFDNSAVQVDPSAQEGTNGLTDQELKIFKQIVQNIFTWFSLKQSTRSKITDFNKETAYVRRKMRLHYANKPIIQPMDVVYIFASSKTGIDSRVTKGFNFSYANNSLLNKLDQAIGNIESAFDDIRNGFSGGQTAGSFVEAEKNAIAGSDFPMWLWTMLRNEMTRESAGTCIFVGPVESASHSYSSEPGKYTLSVQIKDNSYYLQMGQLNINPSVKVYNGALYDPLTPFKTEFNESSGMIEEEIPELLDENKLLLASNSFREKAGRFKGTTINGDKYNVLDYERVRQDLFGGIYGNAQRADFSSKTAEATNLRQVFREPDGFVYRWKEGIGSLTMWGEPYSNTSVGSFRQEIPAQITKSPFAGQDVMNVLSLMITGKPYNFNTFMYAAIRSGKLNNTDFSSMSYFRGLIGDIEETNATWGNFVPFKKMIMNEQAYAWSVKGSFELTTTNKKLSDLLRKRAQTFDQVARVMSSAINTPQYYTVGPEGQVSGSSQSLATAPIQDLTAQIARYDNEIKQQQASWDSMYESTAEKSPNALSVFGNDISFDPDVSELGGTATDSELRRKMSEFRKKLNYLTLRRLWKVKANEDINLFIVDDSYDKNYDIQAFERGIQDLGLFSSTFTDVAAEARNVAGILGLELFANTQGHIIARPPQYNRMPKSVFRDMVQTKAQTGIQLFPRYLESLMFNKMDGMTDRLEIIEDQIRLRSAALGYTDDTAVAKFLGNEFRFVTEEVDGKLGSKDFRSLLNQSNPDLSEDSAKMALKDLSDTLAFPLNARRSFDIVKRADVVNDQNNFVGSNTYIFDRIKTISTRLRTEKNIQNAPASREAVFSNSRATAVTSRIEQTDILNVTEQIASLLAERQQVIKILSNTVRNYTEGLTLNEENSEAADSVLLPNLNKTEDDVEFPELLEHMIEDNNVDDLGYKSGKRYVIEDSQIRNLTIREVAPPHTVIQVDGKLATGLVDWPGNTALAGGAGHGGNAMGSAWAADYDMWRMYGFRSPNAVQAPFFSNPNTQCAPYAVFLLNLARKQIFSGSVEVIGNEYIQPGEVYYIEDRNLLFYSESVSQTFTYGSTFTTSINLTYGHNPGEYIPTQLDIIGKGLYANRHNANSLRHMRHGRTDGDVHVGTIVVDQTAIQLVSPLEGLVSGVYGDQNRKTLSNILLATTGLLNPSRLSDKVNIELRVYKNTAPDMQIQVNNDLISVADEILFWVNNPTQIADDGETLLPDNVTQPSIDLENVFISTVEVDLSSEDTSELRSSSSSAVSAARSILNSGVQASLISSVGAEEQGGDSSYQTSGTGSAQDATSSSDAALKAQAKELITILANNVIDIWVTKTPQDQVLEEKAADNQAALTTNDEIKKIATDYIERLRAEIDALAED